jgi:hypothetical protein
MGLERQINLFLPKVVIFDNEQQHQKKTQARSARGRGTFNALFIGKC